MILVSIWFYIPVYLRITFTAPVFSDQLSVGLLLSFNLAAENMEVLKIWTLTTCTRGDLRHFYESQYFCK